MKIDADKLINILEHRIKMIKVGFLLSGIKPKGYKRAINIYAWVIEQIKQLVNEEQQREDHQANYKIDIDMFDEEEIYTNCTVQVLHNSITDDYSIGFWNNEKGVEE